MTIQHTPIPFTSSGIVYAGDGKESIVIHAAGRNIARIFTPNGPLGCNSNSPITMATAEANAEFIVLAANSHDALVEALGEMTIWASKNAPEAIINNALAVLKQAKGEAK